MRWPWSPRESVKVNGHALERAAAIQRVISSMGVSMADAGAAAVRNLESATASPSRRESRRCEDWYAAGFDRDEMERNAKRCFERTRIPQRIHGHLFGHLCTSSCRVVAGEEIE